MSKSRYGIYKYPLLIQCGNTKRDYKTQAWDLYTQGLWQTFGTWYRKNRIDPFPTYVVSAKYGIIPITKEIEPYNKVIVPDSTKTLKPHEIRVQDVLPILRRTWGKRGKNVMFVGAALYQKALEEIGLIVHNIADQPEFLDSPHTDPKTKVTGTWRTVPKGIGTYRGALRWLLTTKARLMQRYRERRSKKFFPFENRIVQNLSKRFGDAQNLIDRGKSRFEQFGELGDDISIGAKTSKARKKLRAKEFLYDPYDQAKLIVEKLFFFDKVDMDYEYGYGTPKYSETIMILDGTHPYIAKSKFTHDHILQEFFIPEQKADGTPLSDTVRWKLMTLLNDFLIQSMESTLGVQEEEDIVIRIAILGKISQLAQGKNLKPGEYKKIKDRVQQKYGKIFSRLRKMREDREGKEDLAWKEYVSLTSAVSEKEEEYKKAYKACRKERYEASKIGETISCDEIKKKLDFWKNSYPNRDEYITPEVHDISVESYALLVDAVGRFLAGKEDRLVITNVTKEFAQEFVKKHHSALPNINLRGLMMTIGVLDYDGRVVAVGVANTPTGKFEATQGRKNLDPNNILELTRIASDGSVKGASSMLTSRFMDLLPYTVRGDPKKDNLFVTYSLNREEGTTYRALKDKGLRPTAYLERTTALPSGTRKKSDPKKSLANIDKVRWEYGTGALDSQWDVLKRVG